MINWFAAINAKSGNTNSIARIDQNRNWHQSVSHLQNWKINPDQNKYLHQRHFDRCPDHTKQRLSINKHRHSMKITLNKYCYTFTSRKINVDFSVAKLCKKTNNCTTKKVKAWPKKNSIDILWHLRRGLVENERMKSWILFKTRCIEMHLMRELRDPSLSFIAESPL